MGFLIANRTVCIALPNRGLTKTRLRLLTSGIWTEHAPGVRAAPSEAVCTESYAAHFARNPDRTGHLGAALAHVGVWKTVRDRTVVLEDDVLTEWGFRWTLRRRLEEMDRRDPLWDVLLLGFSCGYEHYDACHENDACALRNGVTDVKVWAGMWAYVVNGRRSARRMLAGFFPMTWHLEYNLQRLGLRVYGCVPNIVFHPGSFSADSWYYSFDKPCRGYVSDTMKT